MDLKIVKDILLDNRNVESVCCYEHKEYKQNTYDCAVFCDLVVDGKRIPVMIGISDTWRTTLFDFYIRDNDVFPFIPHVEKNGKICLYDLEAVLIDANFEGVLTQCIQRAIDTIRTGLSGENIKDFIEEFNSYWLQLPRVIIAKLDAPSTRNTARLKYVYDLSAAKKQTDIIQQKLLESSTELFACTDSSNMFITWEITGTQKNGLYICVDLEEYLYPPDPRQNLSEGYINQLLGMAGEAGIGRLLKKARDPLVLIFDLLQPDKTRVILGAMCSKASMAGTEGKYQLGCKSEIRPLCVTRVDVEYLQSRTADTANPLRGRKCLLIGCGSIGSYIAGMMVKSGCDDITLVDNQFLNEENIYRHLLGKQYVGDYKSVALDKHLKNNVPDISVKSLVDRIEDLAMEESVDFSNYDFVLAATGNHNVNRWINNYIKTNEIKVPVVYTWNEPLDIGCHVLFIDYSSGGDFESIFSSDENGEYDKTAYCCSNQIITRNQSGCGGSFIPYGSEVSIQSAMLTVDILKQFYTRRIACDLLISCKGNGFFFHRAGLEHTNRYDNQLEMIATEHLSDIL